MKDFSDFFGIDGFLEHELSSFEYRESQQQMAELIFQSLEKNSNAIVEAGTGTGKTMAYLIPAIVHAKENDEKIAISTETKALQRQLVEKDLPLVQNIFHKYLGVEFKYSIALGSSNYPCRRRFDHFVKKGEYEKSDMEYIEKIISLFKSRKIFTSHEADVPFRIWAEICRDSEMCEQQRCFLSYNCPFMAAKREWMQSDVLVINHYLFFSNIASGKTFLPMTETVIFDEAHSLESVAIGQLGFSIDYEMLVSLLQRFHQKKGRGAIYVIEDEDFRDKAIAFVDKISREANKFFEKLRNDFGEKEITRRIKSEVPTGYDLLKTLEDFVDLLDECKEQSGEDFKIVFEPARLRITAYKNSLHAFLHQTLEEYVYWIEKNESGLLGNIFLNARPIKVDRAFINDVYPFYKSSVFVSATLSVKDDFSFFKESIGFNDGLEKIFPSPFDYSRQMIMFLSGQLPEPDDSEYTDVTAKYCEEMIKITEGNCLILFTSYSTLKNIKSLLAKRIDNLIFSQDEMTASKALALYLANPGSVLMGTHSFWQGIDLPGDLLRCVIITRLPFSVPDTPVMEARVEMCKNSGHNPFVHIQIPEAVLKMRQGVGRLIRSAADIGIVAILDSRIKTKQYGSIFEKSLPNCVKVSTIGELKGKYREILLKS
ncbi:MAG TPA: helicase C-terminal domain-containing protein [Spirochaetota bacterium]|nr:helicase C-terminal domain-containing protein [Spirochaetota bacterium]HRU64380.1 helicase C-terminal domain-containing protein [Spirochaetota bacterium]